MASKRVVCVNYGPSRDGTHQHITYLGVGNATGYENQVAVPDAVSQLQSPWGDRYYTISPSTGQRADIIEAERGCRTCGHRPYVKTDPDGIIDDNLSDLSRCQVS